jgi:hypothetical protein
MILTTRIRRIYLAMHRVDFRRHHDGLLAEAFKLNLDPFRGDVVIFVGRVKNQIKVLYADETGLWLSWKVFTLESMKTRFRFLSEPICSVISQGELAMLLEGSAYTLQRKVTPYFPKNSPLTNPHPIDDSNHINSV